jgi:DNA (cytosine-5)-methyltransferase 1
MKCDPISFALDFGHELIVDNFAGGGGASTGIEMAFGRPVDIAVNHDGEALAMHAANHPTTKHYREDVFAVHPGFVTNQQPIGLAWFSPDCKHHSKAKGGKPREQKIRGLAWVTLKWATFQSPRCIALENVEEFQDWGPLDIDGRPIKAEKGRTFRAFMSALTTGLDRDHPDVEEIYETLGADFPMGRLHAGLGYKAEYRVLRACDYGTPTIRKRLYVFARRDGLPIRWPVPTHGDPKSVAVKMGKLKPFRTAAECIDFEDDARSIFDRERPLVENTERRVAKGAWRHVLTNPTPYIVGVGGRMGQSPARSVRKPAQTVTAKADSCLAQPVFTPFLTEHANASNQRTMAADEPVRTICAQVKGGHFSVVSPLIVPLRGTSPSHTSSHSPLAPLSVVSGGGTHHALTAAHLITIGYGEREGQPARAQSVENSLGTIVAANKHALVAAHLLHLTHHGDRPGSSLDDSLPTVTAAHRGEQAIAAAYFEQANGGFYSGEGRPADAPMSTVTATGSNQQLVTAYCIKYYSEGGQSQDLQDPMHTVPTKDRMGLVQMIQVPIITLAPEFRRRAKQCADLMHRYVPEHFPEPAEMVLVAHDGIWWVLVDITLRMLKPRELARAQGFPDSYVLDPLINGKPLSKSAQVRMIGNSVCPPVAAAIIRANFAHEMEMKGVAA